MSFTDEDMKRLKESLADSEQDLDWMYGGPEDDKFSALLARLEAAEELIKSKPYQVFAEDLYRAWLEKAGKESK